MIRDMLTLIAAIADNNVIGHENTIPWRIPEDMRRFKEATTGKTVLMGRKTWESLPEKYRPLPGRKNVVVTRQKNFLFPDGVFHFTSIEDALRACANEDVMVIGGAEIYRQTMPLADALIITRVHQTVEGDVFFPEIDPQTWKESLREEHNGFTFIEYVRIPSHHR